MSFILGVTVCSKCNITKWFQVRLKFFFTLSLLSVWLIKIYGDVEKNIFILSFLHNGHTCRLSDYFYYQTNSTKTVIIPYFNGFPWFSTSGSACADYDLHFWFIMHHAFTAFALLCVIKVLLKSSSKWKEFYRKS